MEYVSEMVLLDVGIDDDVGILVRAPGSKQPVNTMCD